jgi:hypothetical protein
MKIIKRAVNPDLKIKKTTGKDVALNVSFQDALIRCGILILIPLMLLLIDKHLIIYSAPVLAYLFMSAITRFCWVKYAWHRYIKHDPKPVLPPYGQDQNYPEESV